MKQINGCQRVLDLGRVFVGLQLIMTSTAFASKRLEYMAVVTNVLDGNSVVISNRPSWGGGYLNLPNIIQLKGVEAPLLNHMGGAEAKKSLSSLTLNKTIQFIESLDGGVSHGASLFLINESRQYTEEDCVNYIMVKTGMARWTGGPMTGDISAQTMEEAQRQAQESQKGIWSPSAATAVQVPVIISNSSTIVSSNGQMSIKVDSPASENVASVPDTSSVSLLRVSLTIGVGLLAFLGLVIWFRRKL